MAEIKQAKFIDQTGQEKDAVFIGAERAIFDDNGKRLDQKLDEMKKATGLVATDKNGLVGGSGEEVSLQALIDGVSNRIINELVTNSALTQTLANYMTKALMSNVQVNDSGKVPTSALAYAMQQAITKNKEDVAKLNSEAKNLIMVKSHVSDPKEVIPGSVADFDFSVSIAGYTAIGVIGTFLPAYGDVSLVYASLINPTTVKMRVINTGTEPQKGEKVNVSVLYVKNIST